MVKLARQKVKNDFSIFLDEIKLTYGRAIYKEVRRELIQIYSQNSDVLPAQINEMAVLERYTKKYQISQIIDSSARNLVFETSIF